QSKALDPPKQIHLDSGFISVASGENHTVLGGVGLEDRPDGGIDFRIHEHDILFVLECFERHLGSELDGAGNVHQDINVLRAGEQKRIFCDDRLTSANGVVQLPLSGSNNYIRKSRVIIEAKSLLKV